LRSKAQTGIVSDVAVLLVTSGERAGERVEVSGNFVIGRAGTDLVLDDPEVSRRHAVIRDHDGLVEIEDLGSRNGTRVNGALVGSATPLASGDQIRIGQTNLAIEIAAEATATVLSAIPTLEEGVSLPTTAGESAESPLFAGQPTAPRGGVASRQTAFKSVTFSLMLLVPIALVIYFWQVG
jgi:pSer/pThr/pTyr-binding forkhead associated (FHA) protein